MDWWLIEIKTLLFTMGGSYSDFIAGICVYMCAERFFHTLQTNEINGSGDVIPQNCMFALPKDTLPKLHKRRDQLCCVEDQLTGIDVSADDN